MEQFGRMILTLPFRFVFLRPSHPSGKTFQFKHILLTLVLAKIIDGPVGLDIHLPGTGFYLFSTE